MDDAKLNELAMQYDPFPLLQEMSQGQQAPAPGQPGMAGVMNPQMQPQAGMMPMPAPKPIAPAPAQQSFSSILGR